ncbi:MAG: MerR family transcriptional regulator [Candidatus Nanopelagicaceae bacterium]|nr:MerR family transcriptional regulator [Candidatus Nanopelagicaceae bacterium]
MNDQPELNGVSEELPVYVISIAAELAGMHPQTLRQYDRLGLVSPGRAVGRGRRYSLRDILVLRNIQKLASNGINLAGISKIMELEATVTQLGDEVAQLRVEVDALLLANPPKGLAIREKQNMVIWSDENK